MFAQVPAVVDRCQVCGRWLQLSGDPTTMINTDQQLIARNIILIDQGAFFNCCVHVIMYSYYALSTLGESVR